MNIYLRKVFSQHFNPSTLQLFNLSTLLGSIPRAVRPMPDVVPQPRRGVMFVEREEFPTLPAPDRKVYCGT